MSEEIKGIWEQMHTPNKHYITAIDPVKEEEPSCVMYNGPFVTDKIEEADSIGYKISTNSWSWTTPTSHINYSTSDVTELLASMYNQAAVPVAPNEVIQEEPKKVKSRNGVYYRKITVGALKYWELSFDKYFIKRLTYLVGFYSLERAIKEYKKYG